MGVGDTIAFAALMIGLIAVSGMVFSAWSERLKFKTRELEVRLAEAQARTGHDEAAQAERLEARVLERLATDKSGALAREIEDLRGARVD